MHKYVSRVPASLAVRIGVTVVLIVPGFAGAQEGDRQSREATSADSLYTSAALRTLVAAVAQKNTRVPPGLVSYRARAETEFSFLTRWPNGTEGTDQIEQVETILRWLRSGAFSQHVIGYRAQLSGVNLSALGIVRQAWTVPVLYGNRLDLFAGSDTTERRRLRRRAGSNASVAVVHPFAADRERVYRFSGGDTVLTLRAGTEVIPVARVHVVPRSRIAQPTALFEGNVYVDATRHQIVRMRGTFSLVGVHRSLGARIEDAAMQSAFFVDLTNAEVDGQFWLPTTQRIEAQIGSAAAGDTRSVLRVVTHFADYTLNDTTVVAPPPAADTLELLPHALTFAPSDSVAHSEQWDAPLGLATASVRANDFRDLLPDRWRNTGRPRLDFRTDQFSDIVHFDRVEGLYTGFGAALAFRDAAPGVTARANAGWAWWERTARGSLTLEWNRDQWFAGVEGSRTLDNTNDFTTPHLSGPGLIALVAQDNYDYVDRREARVYAAHIWGGPAATPVVTRIELGPGEDDGDRARLRKGIFPPDWFMSDSLLRPNRGVLKGDYVRGAVLIAYNPAVDAGLVGSGVGARLRYEGAVGQLAWQRVEGRVTAHRPVGPFVIGARLDAGVVAASRIPPQQLFEIGYTEGLLAYDYKEFGGNQAAVLQEHIRYALPIWRAPLRVEGVILPSPAPTLALEVQHGWAAASTTAAREALIALGPRVNPATDAPLIDPVIGAYYPASKPTGDARTSANVVLRFFGGSIGVGIARPLSGDGSSPGFQLVFRLAGGL